MIGELTMNIEKDYYAILGVLPSVESTVLSAVYRALQKKYHPDVYSGLKADAERLAKEINEAYAVLSNAGQRREYDQKRGSTQERSGNYEPESDRGGASRSGIDDTLKGKWDYIVRYYPDAELFRIELSELSSALALTYQFTLLQTKSIARAADLRTNLKQQFLNRYFGNNKTIHAFVVNAIQADRRDVAAEVNRAIKVLGSPTSEETSKFISTVRRVTGWSDHGFRSETQRGEDNFETSDAARKKSAETMATASASKQKVVDEFPLWWVIAIVLLIAVGLLSMAR